MVVRRQRWWPPRLSCCWTPRARPTRRTGKGAARLIQCAGAADGTADVSGTHYNSKSALNEHAHALWYCISMPQKSYRNHRHDRSSGAPQEAARS